MGTLQKWRNTMISQQLLARGITNGRVINAMRAIDRSVFAPQYSIDVAYQDSALPIGYGQTISQPYIVGFMTQALNPVGNETILEIGTGSGYQAAILSQLAKAVYTIEVVPQLAAEAQSRFKKLGLHNVYATIGDGYLGWPEHAPFDAIILTAAPPQVPATLLAQLRDGGRLLAPVGEADQELRLITKHGAALDEQRLIPVRFVPMVHAPNQRCC